MIDAQTITQAARILRNSVCATALTGAGISTPSGIPDFRSPGSGLWELVNQFEVASLYAFQRHPEAFYEWVRPLAHLIANAVPNPAHFALAELGKMGVLKGIITQNIDGLHQRASSKVVYEIHGHLRRATCIRCYTSSSTESMIAEFLETGTIPRCANCNGVMKPDIILLGEQLPARVIVAAQQAARNSDVIIVAGSSLQVAPAGDIPLLTVEGGGKLIIVNLETTYLDDRADVIIRADVADALPRLVESIRSMEDD
jgi:NAD-dependent deacetylase